MNEPDKLPSVWDALDSRPWDGAVLPSGRVLSDEEWQDRWDQARANVARSLAQMDITVRTVMVRERLTVRLRYWVSHR